MKAFKVKAIVVLSLLSLIAVMHSAYAIGLEASLGVWHQNPQGDIGYKGTELETDRDLNYSSNTKIFGRAKIDMPLFIPNIYLMATPMSFDGSGNKTINFTFGDTTFTSNTRFTSTLKLDHYDVALYYGMPFIETVTLGKVNVEAGLNARVIDVKAEVTQGAATESKNLVIPVPMVYIGAQLNLIDKLSIEAELRAIAYSSNHYYDLIGRGKYKFFGPAFLGVGYRYEEVKIDKEDLKANLSFSGPFAEAGIEF